MLVICWPVGSNIWFHDALGPGDFGTQVIGGEVRVLLGHADLRVSEDLRERQQVAPPHHEPRGEVVAAIVEVPVIELGPLHGRLPRRAARGASRPDPETGRRIASARTLQSCSHRAVADAARESRNHYPRPLLASVTMVTRLGAGSRVESWRPR